MQFVDKNDPLVDSRFDLTLLKRLSESENVRAVFDQAKTDWKQDQHYSQQGLSQQQPDMSITTDEEEQAIQSCVDYHFEKYYLPTMTVIQANAYMLSIEKVLQFPDQLPVNSGAPLLIESCHHQSIFSILYWLVINLAHSSHYNHVIMMHQQEDIDPRLMAQKNVAKAWHNIDFDLIRFDSTSQWYKSLKKTVTANTIILYLGDMPTRLFDSNSLGDTQCQLTLSRTSSPALAVKRFSAAKKISQKLKATHHICNIQDDRSVQLTLASQALTLTCPLESWVFWPALGSLYES